jgi:hypothetical protein
MQTLLASEWNQMAKGRNYTSKIKEPCTKTEEEEEEEEEDITTTHTFQSLQLFYSVRASTWQKSIEDKLRPRESYGVSSQKRKKENLKI